MKKILITGSNGLLGQKILDLLDKCTEYEVIATSSGENRHSGGSYTYCSMDVTDRDCILGVFERFIPNYVIHTAAMTNVDGCEAEREKCYALNVSSVKYLEEACRLHQAHLVHISTDFIFDGLNGPYKEEDKPNPLSYYGETKWLSEKVLMESSIPYSILRTSILFGVVKDMTRSNIVLWAKGALEKGQSLNIVEDQIRTPTLSEDLAAACIEVVNRKATGVFNVSGKDTMSMYELVLHVADYWKLDKSLVKPILSSALKMAAPRPLRTGFDLHKAQKVLNYQPHSFKEALKIVDTQLKNMQ